MKLKVVRRRAVVPSILLLFCAVGAGAALWPMRLAAQASAGAQDPDQYRDPDQDHGQDQSQGTVTETRTVLGKPLPTASSATPQDANPQTAPNSGATRAATSAGTTSITANMTANEAVASSPHGREAEKQYLKGAKALDEQDVRGALKYFSRAVELDPQNQRYTVAREIARQHLVTLLVEEAEKSRMTGHSDVERAKLAEALTLDPKNGIATQHLDELAGEAVNPLGQARNGPTGGIEPPIELAPNPIRASFHVRASAAALLQQVVSAYGITATVDDSVVAQIRRIDADDVDYAQAAQMARLVTGTFFVPLDPKRVLIAGDTKANRDKFERLAEETVYLSGLTPPEIVDVGNIARNVFDAPTAAVLQQRGFMTVRAPEGRIQALNAVLSDLLEGKSQVELEIRAFEVSTTRMRNIGIVLPQQTTFFNVDSEVNSLIANNQSLVNEIVSSGLANAGDTLAIAALLIASGQVTGSILSQPFVLFGGGLTETGLVPGAVSGNLALNSSDVRSLDDVKLRILDQEAATFRTGTRYPITTSTFTSTAASIPGVSTAGLSSTLSSLGISTSALSGISQATIPQIQYEDLGLTLKATPRVQMNKDVTLKLNVKIEALGGASVDNIPILNNREFDAVITVKDGGSIMMMSNLTRQESNAVSGLPGLSELPGLGSGTNKSTEYDVSRLVIMVTTHIVRLSHTNSVGRMVILPLHP